MGKYRVEYSREVESESHSDAMLDVTGDFYFTKKDMGDTGVFTVTECGGMGGSKRSYRFKYAVEDGEPIVDVYPMDDPKEKEGM